MTEIKKKKSPIKKIALSLFGLGLLSAIVVGLLGLRWYNTGLRPVNEGATEIIRLEVQPGETAAAIGQELVDQGLIRDQRVFDLYLRLNNLQGSVQAGSYDLSPSQSLQEIVAEIGTGRVESTQFTILPGKRLDQLAADFVEAGFTQAEVDEALDHRLYQDHPISRYKPADASLEGYLFPETFSVDASTTVANIVERSLDEFDANITDELVAGLDAQGLDIHESITLASIIEKEVFDELDKQKVSQVFLKRLREGIMLGSDVTFFYAAAVFGGEALPSLDNPYNTRLYSGLPPGPISNFSLSTIESITNPTDTEYLYFVAGDDGITRFNETLAGHEADAAAFCIELCKL